MILLSSILISVDIRCITTGLLLFLSFFVQALQIYAAIEVCETQLLPSSTQWTPILRVIALCSKVAFYGADMLVKRINAAQINFLFFLKMGYDLSMWCVKLIMRDSKQILFRKLFLNFQYLHIFNKDGCYRSKLVGKQYVWTYVFTFIQMKN